MSTLTVEPFGSHAAVARAKSLVVMPGLWTPTPAMAAPVAAAFLSTSRKARPAEARKRRMAFVAANGLLVLVPCAIVLDRWAAAGAFDTSFHAVQAVELVAGAINLTLMGLNVRDGLRMAGRLRVAQTSVNRS